MTDDADDELRSGCVGFWVEVLLSWRALAIYVPVALFWMPQTLEKAGVLRENHFIVANQLEIQLASFALGLVGFVTAVHWRHDREMKEAVERIEDLRREKLVRPDIDVDFQKGSEYVPAVRTRKMKAEVIRERDQMEEDLEGYEERIREANEVIGSLEAEEQLSKPEQQRLERAREKRDTAREQRDKWEELRDESIEERLREIRKGKLFVDFHVRLTNSSEQVPARLIGVNLEPCESGSNNFSYLPEETSVTEEVDGGDGELEIHPNTSMLITHTAEVRVPSGKDFLAFLDTLDEVDDKSRDCVRFELSFRGPGETYTVEFEKTVYLRPFKETLLEHWQSHDFDAALDHLEEEPATV